MRTLVFLLALTAATSASASVIADTGYIALGPSQGNSVFGGPNFNLTGTFDWGNGGYIYAGTITPTTKIMVNTNMLWSAGTFSYFGTPYSIPNPVSDKSGSFYNAVLTGAAVPISGPGIYYGTFTGAGDLRRNWNTFAPLPPLNVINDTWSGQGIVIITVATNPIGTQTNYRVTDMVYTFSSVPEPASCLLTAAALAAAGFYSKRKRLNQIQPRG